MAALTDSAVVDRVIEHSGPTSPNLTFIAERQPPLHIGGLKVLMAVEAGAECF